MMRALRQKAPRLMVSVPAKQAALPRQNAPRSNQTLLPAPRSNIWRGAGKFRRLSNEPSRGRGGEHGAGEDIFPPPYPIRGTNQRRHFRRIPSPNPHNPTPKIITRTLKKPKSVYCQKNSQAARTIGFSLQLSFFLKRKRVPLVSPVPLKPPAQV